MTVVSSQAGLAIPLEDQQLIGTMPEIWSPILSSFQLCVSSGQSLDRLGNRGDMRDDLAEVLFQSFLRKANVSGSGTDRDVHALTLSIQHLLCRPGRHQPSFQGALRDGFRGAVLARSAVNRDRKTEWSLVSAV